MAEPKDVLLENLKETLKGAQMYLLSGSGTALFLLLLAARGQLAAGAVAQEVKVPFCRSKRTHIWRGVDRPHHLPPVRMDDCQFRKAYQTDQKPVS